MLNKSRLFRAQQRMRDQGFDAYLILTHDDYIYFFGEDCFQPRAIQICSDLPERGSGGT